LKSRGGVRRRVSLLALLLVVGSQLAGAVGAIAAPGTALEFTGAGRYVTFGAAPGLGTPTFTVETWFYREGAGTTATTGGSGSGVVAVPLITKGRGEVDGDNRDLNYFLGIRPTDNVLVADFEEGATGASPGLNHPLAGTTAITGNAWHHAAATYDGTTLRLYLDGAPNGQVTVGRPPRSDSIQHAALGTALNSSGTPAGNFVGILDEARVWNYARTQQQIATGRNTEITSAPGLLGRWGMNEGVGTTVGDSSGNGNVGTAVGNPTWVPGYTFDAAPDTTPPAAPQNLAAGAGDGAVSLTWTANTESDLAGYNVYRSTQTPVSTSGQTLNGDTLVSTPSFFDSTASNGTAYHYAVTAVDTSTNASGPSNEVAATPAVSTDPVILSAGDIADCGNLTDEATAAILRQNSGTVIALGDNVYPDATLDEFNNCYGPSWGTEKARTAPVIGNHEYHTVGASGYFDYFGQAAHPNTGYYSFEQGTWHVVVLNSECAEVGGCGASSPQGQWLSADLAAHQGTNVLAVMHRPLFSSEIVGQITDTLPLWRTLYAAGADLILVGHHHLYERFAPLTPDGDIDTQFGIRQFTVGTGGESHDPIREVKPTSEVRNNTAFGVLRVVLGPDSYTWQFIPVAGDTFTDFGSSLVHVAPGTQNQAPVVDSVSIDQASPRTNDTLSVTVQSHDPDGDAVTSSYQWRVNGADIPGATGPTLNLSGAGNGDRGDQVSVRVTASDGSARSAPLTSSPVTVGDTAPSATVSLSDPAPPTNAVLTATATPADADSDPVTLTYVWKVNGTVQKTTSGTSSTTDTFDLSVPGHGDAGDTVTVEVTPSDGTLSGSPASASATVDRTAPATPSGLVATVTSVSIELDWANNTESDLAGYTVYRATSSSGPFSVMASGLAASAYGDPTALQGQAYWYGVSAVDTSGNESAAAQVNARRVIAFRASSTATNQVTTSLTTPRPAGVQTGDLLLSAVTIAGNQTITAPPGWTLVRSDNKSSSITQAVYSHVAASGDPSSFKWTLSKAVGASGVIAAYSGVASTQPVEASGGTASGSSKSIVAPSVTVSTPDDLIVGVFGIATSTSVTPPPGMLLRGQASRGGTGKVTTAVCDRIKPSSGATGSLTATAGAAAANVGQVVAVRPGP
jgi:fibronectin type 3 domain-containing protein